MKTIFCYISLFLVLTACKIEEIGLPRELSCTLDQTPVIDHPNQASFQNIIDQAVASGFVGISAVIDGPEGFWMGTAGKADIGADIDMQPCHRLMIGSCTKTFTAALTFLLIEEGRFELDDQLGELLPKGVLKNIENASEASIRQVLNHTSGIADYYTLRFESDRLAYTNNDFSMLDILDYTRGKKASHGLGERYTYSNTNYLLLSILFEELLDQPVQEIYQDYLFGPFGLSQTEYAFEVSADLARGYGNLIGNKIVETQRLYQDEMGSGDGAIVSTAYDLSRFIRLLGQGQIVSESSLAIMTDDFELPEDEQAPAVGFLRNGHGLEYYITEAGTGYGHLGGVDGFNTVMLYYPERQTSVCFSFNGGIFQKNNYAHLFNDLTGAAL